MLHKSAVNKAYVEAFRKGYGIRPAFHSVAGYDAMHLLHQALEKISGNANGDTLMAAMKGMSWESPRGQIAIDPETRDIIQNEYIRRVEKVNGELYNVAPLSKRSRIRSMALRNESDDRLITIRG